MSTRYASLGTGISRSPKTSVVQPWYRRGRIRYIGTTSAVSQTATYGASAHAKGAWTQVTANTTENVSMVVLVVTVAASATDTSTLLDIGVGAAGAETVIVPDVAVGSHSICNTMIPVAIPSGSRVAVRIQGTRTSPTTGTFALHLFETDDYATTPTSVDIIGISTATSAATALSGAAGSWVELTSSTAKDYQTLVIVPSSSSTDIANAVSVYTLGVGASGSEREIGVVLPSFNGSSEMTQTGAGTVRSAQVPPVCAFVPAGSRLAVRHYGIATNPDRYNVCLIGIPYV